MTEGRMNPQVKAGVLARLADPANKQDQGRLRSDGDLPGDGKGGVCCLELVCQEAIKAGVIPEPVYQDGHWIYGDPGDTADAYLPLAVMRHAGFENTDPEFDFGGLADPEGEPLHLSWSEANDDEGYTFLQIHDLVNYFC